MQELLFGVPQVSILGPLLFKIFLYDLILTVKFMSLKSGLLSIKIDLILEKLELTASETFQWFADNAVKTNPEKDHLLLTTQNEKDVIFVGNKLKNNASEVLGTTVNSKHIYNEHVNKIFDKTSQKLNEIARVMSFMSIKKKGIYENIH